jgi:hypothetical protein
MPKIINKDKDRFPFSSDISLRLEGTLIVYGGDLVMATSSGSDNNFKICSITATGAAGEPYKTVSKTDPKLEYPIWDPGFIENNELFYMMRIPARKQYQGLCHKNVRSVSPSGGGYSDLNPASITILKQIKWNWSGATVPYKKALEDSAKRGFSILNKRIAIQSGQLYVGLIKAGTVHKTGVELSEAHKNNSMIHFFLAQSGVPIC